jgi:hypothetical protein
VLVQQELLAACQSLVVVHPNWWGKPPAMMAGWMDRMLARGVAYRLGSADEAPEPLLGIWGRCVAEYLPGAVYQRRTFGPVGTSSADERSDWLRGVDDLVAGLP